MTQPPPEDAAAQAAAKAAADAAAAKTAADAKAAADATAAAAAAAAAAGADKGYPENTPIEQMTGPQREAYWRHYARQHEDRAKVFNGLTPERLKELQDAEARVKQLDYDLASEKEKAVTDAKTSARGEVMAELLPELVHARFEAAAGGRLSAEQITGILAPLDLKFFTGQDGKVDTAKVNAYVEQIAPATGGTQQQRKGPSGAGSGRSGSGSDGGSGSSVAAGRAMFVDRHGKPNTQ